MCSSAPCFCPLPKFKSRAGIPLSMRVHGGCTQSTTATTAAEKDFCISISLLSIRKEGGGGARQSSDPAARARQLALPKQKRTIGGPRDCRRANHGSIVEIERPHLSLSYVIRSGCRANGNPTPERDERRMVSSPVLCVPQPHLSLSTSTIVMGCPTLELLPSNA